MAIISLEKLLISLKYPLTAFVQTGILKENQKSSEVLKFLANEYHSHSHTHASKEFDSQYELETSLQILQDMFDQENFGYRAPFGKLYPGDHEKLKDLGYHFDSSVFPSVRPGKFNHLDQPILPYRLPCGLMEVPFGVMPYSRLILGISYMKLFGPNFYHVMESFCGLPRVLVCYAHLHDFFPTEAIKSFPPAIRMAFSRNKENGINIARDFLSHLKAKGYIFLGMNELVNKLKEEGV